MGLVGDGDDQHDGDHTDDNDGHGDGDDDDDDDGDDDVLEEGQDVEPVWGKSCHRDIDECELDEHDAVHHLGHDGGDEDANDDGDDDGINGFYEHDTVHQLNRSW